MTSPDAPTPTYSEPWEFAGWGSATRITDLERGDVHVTKLHGVERKLGQWGATAICGNDITSSCLYVSALAGTAAGVYAPFALLIVAGVLYLFRKVYAEAGSALPLNGGTYTLLLNTTNKRMAASAACLTLLSYLATAVISAGEAVHYAHELLSGLNLLWTTVGLLGFFAVLNLVGITESATVALVIFLFHLVTLTVLSGASAIAVVHHSETWSFNWSLPHPSGLMHSLFLGFAAAMLGISGFESSANFIEEQKAGVFPKTLRNMWIAVAIFNPLISFLSLGLVRLDELPQHETSLLAVMGERAAGPWLGVWVSLDAVLVLSGAVLTSYVGVTGLVRRMSLDRCLPQKLLSTSRKRGTNHWIILGFFLLCCSIYLITQGEVSLLAGVYTLSFLSVMALYAIGNMLLKIKRARLPREVRASWVGVSVALLAVLVGLAGNLTAENLSVFGTYLAGVAGVVALMFLRIPLLRMLLFVSYAVIERMSRLNGWVNQAIIGKIKEINELTVIYFTRGDDVATLNRAALYVLENEQTQVMKIVHVYEDERQIPPDLARTLTTIDRMYPQLRIDFLAVQGRFGPAIIEQLSSRLRVAKNFMFIGTPGNDFPHTLDELGGVRVIL